MRACIFCGSPDLTLEDAWPQWFMRRPELAGTGTIEAERVGRAPWKWVKIEPRLKVRFVCAGCNSGWMSQMEGIAKPIVESLLPGERCILTPLQQVDLATWSVKGAMVFEALRGRTPWYFTDAERRDLRTHRRPGAPLKVWIAYCINPPGAYCAATDLGGLNVGSGSPVRGYVTTMAFGPLVIQVMGTRVREGASPSIEFTADSREGPWTELALRIWPLQHGPVPWPASKGLDGIEGLQVFGDRWNPSGQG